MKFSWKKVSATQFTLFMAISNLGNMFFVAALVPLKTYMSWEMSILLVVGLFGVLLLIVKFLNFQKQAQQLATLDSPLDPNAVGLIPDVAELK
jgi:PAT family beta-lactamase induction signal transducer AmpG